MRRFDTFTRCFVLLACAATTAPAAAEIRRPGCDAATLAADKQRNGNVSASTPALDHYYDLSKQMRAAFASAHAEAAEPIAKEYLQAANAFPCNWDYGNAIHNANTVLGLLALRDGRQGDAVAYLRAAGASPGSPQLDTFGPSLLLARDLAHVGEYDAVADYLVSIRRFWNARDHSTVGMLLPYFADPDPIATWIGQLRKHHEPDLSFMNMHAP